MKHSGIWERRKENVQCMKKDQETKGGHVSVDVLLFYFEMFLSTLWKMNPPLEFQRTLTDVFEVLSLGLWANWTTKWSIKKICLLKPSSICCSLNRFFIVFPSFIKSCLWNMNSGSVQQTITCFKDINSNQMLYLPTKSTSGRKKGIHLSGHKYTL